MNKTDIIKQELITNGYSAVGFVSYESSFGHLPWGGWYAEIGEMEFFLGKVFDIAIKNIKSKNITIVESI
jgi:hypothetical protein